MSRSRFFRDQNRKLYRNALSKCAHDRRRQVLTSLLRLMDHEQDAISCAIFAEDARMSLTPPIPFKRPQ
jgi:hypothetical protein